MRRPHSQVLALENTDSMDRPGHLEVADFEHDILPDASKYMRLVEVLEGNHSEVFEARFRMSTWRIDGLPSYSAISYTWGDPESNTAFLINGKTFRIRKNCEFALKQAWWYKSNGYYWIDAICINQGDDEEKGKQVAMMGNVYKTACNVLACVGDHAHDSLFLYRNFAWANKFTEGLWLSFNIRDLMRRTHKLLTILRYLRAAAHFAKRPYFSRLWIVQELKSARKATVMCGADALPKHKIYDLFCVLDISVFDHRWTVGKPRLTQRILRAVLCRRSSYQDQLSAELKNAIFVTEDSSTKHMLLLRSRSLQCTHRRDRIYGIMPLIDWGETVPPIPDYTKSDFEVALDFVQPMFELTRSEEYTLADLCTDIKHVLELSVRSDYMSRALEARRGARESDFAGFSMPVNPPPTQLQSEATAWRLSGEHFISRRQSISSEWKVSNCDGFSAVLPHWVREGDWILRPNEFSVARGSLLVLRDVADGFYSPILGQGHLAPILRRTESPADAVFRIFWDPEDLLVHFIVGHWSSEFSQKEMEFGVCERKTLGSSYAVRQK